jgi:ATP-dependent HslUV protease subunit HslV
MLVVADKDISLTLTGNGDVLEPNDGIIAIGSGGNYALSCARGMIDLPDIDAETIALKSMKVPYRALVCVHACLRERLELT